jgi:steroid delta-isomerase-like uncharacterized protein
MRDISHYDNNTSRSVGILQRSWAGSMFIASMGGEVEPSTGERVTPDEMEALIEAHLRAEGNGDPQGAVANYTDDIEHDVVGFPGSPLRGIPAALEFYRELVREIRTDGEERLHTYYTDNAAIIENLMTATVTGQFLGIPGNGKQVKVRTLHVFEFRNSRISRENLWLDGAAVAAQLTS